MYTLRPLSFTYGALEPYISDTTVSIHYLKHHQNYLNKLNTLLEKNNYDYNYSMEELVTRIDIFPLADRDDILFNLGGVLNHNLYWNSISPDKNNEPIGDLKTKIDGQYGNYSNFKNEFIKTASYLVGSGYTFLVLNKDGNLEIINTSNQDTPYSYDLKPIMALDLWEHAYYLDYQNRRPDYIEAFFSIVDFNKINEEYRKANTKS